MKKVLSLLLVILMLTVVTSCGSEKTESTGNDTGKEETSVAEKKPEYEIGEPIIAVRKDSSDCYVRAFVPVKNDGSTPISLSNTTMKLLDASGNTVDTTNDVKSYPPVINPGEQAVYSTMFFLDYDMDTTGLKATYGDINVNKADKEAVRMTVSDVNFDVFDDSMEPGITLVDCVGKLTNTLSEEVKCSAVSFFYDSNNKLVLASTENSFTVKADAKDFLMDNPYYFTRLSSSDFDFSTINSCKVIVYPNE